jgi:hypothetical protein
MTQDRAIDISTLARGHRLELKTSHHSYSLLYLGDGRIEVCGHPQYCPEPTVVALIGSSLGVGTPFKFWHPVHALITTSTIIGIRQLT